jgi:iron complex outermembrane recepter protein
MNVPMRKFGAALSLGAAASLLALSSYGQTPTTPTTTNDQPMVLEKFVTTGSYLPVSASVTANPVVSLENSEIGMSGTTDALQLIKQLTPYFSGNGNIGTELNNGGAGESNVALRNLTTLVLVNGQRMITSPFSNTNGGLPAVDLNTIPTAMIDKIEILKDGASTVYGSDAIGGVVNVILKKNYTGVEAGVRYGTTGKSDYKTRNVYVMGGASGPDFSITIGAQHFENTPLLTTDRPLTTLSPAEINKLGYAVTSTVYSGSYAGRVNSDILAGSPLAVGAPGYKASINTPPAKTSPTAAPQTLAQLEAAGIYIPISTTPASAAVGGGATILNTTLYGNPLIVSTRRNHFLANAEKQLFGERLVVFSDFIYSQTVNSGSALAPSPLSGVGPGGGNSLSIPANNPYNLFGVVIGVGQASGAPTVRTRLEEVGKRSSVNETNTWRYVGGLKGEINENYNWEADFNYGRSSLVQQVLGGANGANMNQLMIPLLNSSGGYTYNTAGRPLSVLVDANGNNLPVYDFFALPGFNDPASINAVRTTLFQNSVTWLRDVSVRLIGKPVELPAGRLSFAVGVETRTEDLASGVDGLYANGLALGYNPANSFSGGSTSTKGAFIEVGVPLVSPAMGIPAVHSLDVTLADRTEKIKPGGNASTPKFGVLWKPIDESLTLRGTYAKAFLAPSIYYLFGPSSGNSPSLTLPLGDGSSGAGGSTGTMTNIQVNSVELSNPNLKPGKSESWTAGIVYSPKQLKGLTLTLDYYRIKQDHVGSIDYTAVVADLNAKGSGSIYAQDPLGLGQGFVFADGTKLTTTAPNQVNSTNFGTINVARNPAGDQMVEGVDGAIDYVIKTDNIGLFDVGALATWLANYKFRATAKAPYLQYARNFTDNSIGGAGAEGLLPTYVVKPYINYKYQGLSASMFMTYIPKVNNQGTLFGGASTSNDYTLNGLASKIPSYFTADISVSYTLPDFGRTWMRNTTITAGANNAFNKAAPYVASDGSLYAENNTVKGAYDIIGRFYFVELKKKF